MRGKATEKHGDLQTMVDIDRKYVDANIKFTNLLKTPPDFKTADPMDIYYWAKKLVDLTKIK